MQDSTLGNLDCIHVVWPTTCGKACDHSNRGVYIAIPLVLAMMNLTARGPQKSPRPPM